MTSSFYEAIHLIRELGGQVTPHGRDYIPLSSYQKFICSFPGIENIITVRVIDKCQLDNLCNKFTLDRGWLVSKTNDNIYDLQIGNITIKLYVIVDPVVYDLPTVSFYDIDNLNRRLVIRDT